MLCFVPVLRGCVCCYIRKKALLQCLAITERRDMGLYEVPLSMSLLGFGMGTMLTNCYMCGIMLVLRAVFNRLIRHASPTWPMCFRSLMFNLSGHRELLFLLFFIASWTLVVVSVMLYPIILCCSVNGSVCRVFCVFVNCFVKKSLYVWV